MIESILKLMIYKRIQDLNDQDARNLDLWFRHPQNDQRLNKEIEKILDHYIQDASYQVERAFNLIAFRLINEAKQAKP